MMRYLKHLENKDLSLTHAMIPLGSCTMKLNAASEMLPITWAAFAQLHPFCPPAEPTGGTREMFADLEAYSGEITGFDPSRSSPTQGRKVNTPACWSSKRTTLPAARPTATSA